MKSLDKVWIEKTGIKSPNTGMETLIIHNAIKIEKSLDKKKTKELDWEKEFDNLNWNTDKGIMTKAKIIKQSTGETVGQITIPVTKEMVKTFIKSLLTQQRIELLEEILEHNKDEMTGLYDYDGIAQEVIDLVKK